MLECVINVSEGRDPHVIAELAAAAGDDLLDLHTDPHHHRSVLTTVGADAARRVASTAIARLDLGGHEGVHPRIGVVDVVPFVPLPGSTLDDALAAREGFARWLGARGVPCFAYGPERTLPEVRRDAFRTLAPDAGPPEPHPTAGACAVGARSLLVAYNVWLDTSDVAVARTVARALRGPEIRALGLDVGGVAQVSMNLVEPLVVGPAEAFDAVAALAPVARAELVGLLPAAVLDRIPPDRWAALDLSVDRTVEARLDRPAARGAAPAPAPD